MRVADVRAINCEIYGIYPYFIQTVAKRVIVPVSKCNEHQNDWCRCLYHDVKCGDDQNITYKIIHKTSGGALIFLFSIVLF
jgi:hypothetical protein